MVRSVDVLVLRTISVMQLLCSLPLFHFRNIQSVNIGVLIQLAVHGELFSVYSHVGTAKVAATECVPTI
jgi:hypothetical protein